MQITNLIDAKSMIYSSNVYLIRGDWNAMEDVNTLIDAGNDATMLERLQNVYTGLGKHAVEQVILTHSHFDHAGALDVLRERFAPLVYAFSSFIEPDVSLQDGQRIRCGDRTFEVIHTPGHTEDSVCLYCQTDGALFVGDTPVVIQSADATYDHQFIAALERLCSKEVRVIYFGHGAPLTENANAVMRASLDNIYVAIKNAKNK